MDTRRQETAYISLGTAVRRTGLSHQVVQECVERSLIREPLTEADLLKLRRIRRLQELGVNLPGIEIILRMRRRVQVLQIEITHRGRTWGSSERVDAPGIWQRLLPWEPDLE